MRSIFCFFLLNFLFAGCVSASKYEKLEKSYQDLESSSKQDSIQKNEEINFWKNKANTAQDKVDALVNERDREANEKESYRSRVYSIESSKQSLESRNRGLEDEFRRLSQSFQTVSQEKDAYKKQVQELVEKEKRRESQKQNSKEPANTSYVTDTYSNTKSKEDLEPEREWESNLQQAVKLGKLLKRGRNFQIVWDEGDLFRSNETLKESGKEELKRIAEALSKAWKMKLVLEYFYNDPNTSSLAQKKLLEMHATYIKNKPAMQTLVTSLRGNPNVDANLSQKPELVTLYISEE